MKNLFLFLILAISAIVFMVFVVEDPSPTEHSRSNKLCEQVTSGAISYHELVDLISRQFDTTEARSDRLANRMLQGC